MPFENRTKKLQATIRERGLAGAVLFYSRDILYYTGTAQPAYLVVLPEDYMLFVRRGFDFAEKECGLAHERITAESSLATIARRMFPGNGAGQRVGTELDVLTMAQSFAWQRALGARDLVNISSDILAQRMLKDATEIESLRKSCAAVHAGHLRIMLGHGVGLEVNEPPLLARNGKEPLASGMVLTIELHVMQHGGLTLKLEDTVHLTDAGVELLTVSPRELIVVQGDPGTGP